MKNIQKSALWDECLRVSTPSTTRLKLPDVLLHQAEVDALNERLARHLEDGTVIHVSLGGSDGSEITVSRYWRS